MSQVLGQVDTPPTRVDPTKGPGPVNALSVDVEEHFQVQAFAGAIQRTDWETHEFRVERNVERLLEMFEQAQARATFFTLGWIAERQPAMVRRIVEAGHELASHGYHHERVDSQTPEAFRADIRKTKQILE
ncbi:MAG: polysaccharide deacetylase family protein, partial [Alphaproteobacteria bacterium]